MNYSCITDQGIVRNNNEDYILTPGNSIIQLNDSDLNRLGYLFIVCDGVGGHNAGEKASRMAAEYLMDNWYGSMHSDLHDGDRLKAMVHEVNEQILKMSEKFRKFRDMATTLTALLIKGDVCTLCHIGDSRAYLQIGSGIRQLTDDHSPVWDEYKKGDITKNQMRTHPDKHYITQALGFFKEIEVDIITLPLPDKGIFLLCTDGLTDMMPDEAINDILKEDTDFEVKGQVLLEKAMQAGGHDNISLILIEI